MSSTLSNQLDSIVTFNNSQGEKASGTVRGVSRQTVSLEVYNPYSVAQMSEMLSNFTIRRQGRVVYQGSAVVTSLINTGIYLVISVTLTDPWKDLNNLQNDKKAMREEIDRFLNDVSVYKKIDPGFHIAIGNLRNKLSELSRWLEQMDLLTEGAKDDDIIEQIKEPILPSLFEELARFEHEAKQVPPDLVDIHRAFTQRDLHPLTMRSPFVHRTFTKPLGYAGDYEMVNMIFRNPNQGPNTYFKLINNLFLMEGPAVAHRNRITILTKALENLVDKAYKEKRRIKILNLGCGPAREIRQLIASRSMDDRIDFTLLDFSVPTLEYTEASLKEAMKTHGSYPAVQFKRQSVDQILRQSARLEKEQGETYDYIYCAGLFDYFSDKACQRVMRLFYHLVKPGGEIMTTNVHSNNPAQAVMEYIAEWHLVCRSEADMEKLVPFDMPHVIYCDDSGVNVFLEVKKPAR